MNRIINWMEAMPLRRINSNNNIAKSIEFIRDRLNFLGPKKSMESTLFEQISAARDKQVLKNMYIGWSPFE